MKVWQGIKLCQTFFVMYLFVKFVHSHYSRFFQFGIRHFLLHFCKVVTR